MVPRKRGHAEMEAEAPPQEPTMLQKLRNMWQFANIAQYLNLFIDALRIDSDFDIEVCTAAASPLFRCADRVGHRSDAHHIAGPRR
jgi:hypothetical protein